MDIECIPICRVCMQASPEFVDFDMPMQNENEEDTSITYLDFFFECTRIEVEPYEGVTHCFCLPCGDELRSFYKFIKIAEMSDNFLKSKSQKKSGSHKTTKSALRKKHELEHKHVGVSKNNKLDDRANMEKCNNLEEMCMLEENNNQEENQNHRLIKLKVEPVEKTKLKIHDSLNFGFPLSLVKDFDQNEVNSVGESHVNKFIETKLNRRKTKRGPVECVFCHEVVNNQKLLERHLVEEHQRRTKPCEICGKLVIHMRDHLLIHERVKHQLQRPKTECKICSRMISKQAINRHIRHVHLREMRKHKCPECSQTFADAHKLKVHKLRGHKSGMNIKCLLCDRKFENTISLNNHLRIHPCLQHFSEKH